MLDQEQGLDLGIQVPRHPGRVLYALWQSLLDYYGYAGHVADRTSVTRGTDFDETGQLQLNCERRNHRYFSLWPDGSFMLNGYILDRFGWWQAHTFLSRSYAIGKRVVLVRQLERMQDGPGRWYQAGSMFFDERDWRVRTPYLSPDDLTPHVRYRLVLDNNGNWLIAVHQSFVDDGNEVRAQNAQQVLDAGYRFAQDRYDRFQKRAENKGKTPARNPLAVHTENGHLTGEAAVTQMATLLTVHAPRPREAE